MVASPAKQIRSVNAGEFDDGAESRVDIKQYYSGASRMKGVEPVPQSGFRLMGGTVHISRARGDLLPVAITDASTAGGDQSGDAVVV